MQQELCLWEVGKGPRPNINITFPPGFLEVPQVLTVELPRGVHQEARQVTAPLIVTLLKAAVVKLIMRATSEEKNMQVLNTYLDSGFFRGHQ